MINEMFELKRGGEGASFWQTERKSIVFVCIMLLIFAFDAVALKSIDPSLITRYNDDGEVYGDWTVTYTMNEATSTDSKELEQNGVLETSMDWSLNPGEYLSSVTLVVMCSDEDEPGEGFSDEVTADTELAGVNGNVEEREETGACLENTEDDVVLTWTFADVSLADNQTYEASSVSSVEDLFVDGTTGDGVWAAEIRLDVVTPGGIGALDSGEQITATWIVQTFTIELNDYS